MRLLLPLCALLSIAAPAHAAVSYDSCTGTITALPATLTTSGTWCLKADLATSLTTGDIITVATNNVTIDCNGFKIGNLSAGIDTQAIGITANSRSGLTVRNCNLRGFRIGLSLHGSGYVIEDNRIEGSRVSGLRIGGDHMIVRRNLVLDTGGQGAASEGIVVAGIADVRDNIISGVFPKVGGSSQVIGIAATSSGHYTVRGNVVRGLTTLGNPGVLRGIVVGSGEGDVIDNTLSAVPGPETSVAITCNGDNGFVRENRASGFLVLGESCPVEVAGNELRN